jgi:signal transduction histidine kinase
MKQRPEKWGYCGKRRLKQAMHALVPAGIALPALFATAFAQSPANETSANALFGGFDGGFVISAASVLFAFGALVWAMRVSRIEKSGSLIWSQKLARMEAELERSESVLAAHPGLVLVWDDAYEDIDNGWGKPRILGGPAAMAALLTFADDDVDALINPADALLKSLGELPLEEDLPPEEIRTLKDRMYELRAHGVAFSGSVLTKEGRAIEVDGRVAGDQVTLWLTDPAVRLAEDGGVLGQARDRAADLHGALNQLEKLPMPSWRRGAGLRLEWVNRAYIETVEALSLQDVIDNQIEIDPAFKALAEKAREQFMRPGGRRIMDDTVIVNIRGQRRVLRVVETPMHQTGESSLAGVAVDISALDRSKEDLRRHQKAHRDTLDQMTSAVAVFSAAQHIEYYNQAFLDLWKLDDAELRTRPSHGDILDRLHQKARLPEQGDFNEWKRGQLDLYTDNVGPDAMEGSMPDEIWPLPNGKTLRVVRRRHPLGGVLVVFEDITEKLLLETQYNTQISVQRATLNNLAEGVAVFASDGSLRLFNSAFQKLWNLAPERLSELPDFDDLAKGFGHYAEDCDDHWRLLRQRITSLSPQDRAPIPLTEISLNDGRTFAYATAPLPDGASLVTFLDVTDSREREKELKERNEWLEAADRIKSKFVNHISYNLRNPLNTIIGFSEMLETEMFGPLNDRQKDYAANILTASNHLLDLINNIIDLAALDAGKLNLDLGEMNVRETLETVSTYAALRAEDSQINLKTVCEDRIGLVIADETRIKQVLFDLVANAFAFTEEGGTVEMGASREGETVCLWVRDTGRGVSAEDQAKAFDRFESRGPGSGVGLGLALVKSFVELHGGWVSLSSKEGRGTLVALHLPIEGPDMASNEDDAMATMVSDGAIHNDEEMRKAERLPPAAE